MFFVFFVLQVPSLHGSVRVQEAARAVAWRAHVPLPGDGHSPPVGRALLHRAHAPHARVDGERRNIRTIIEKGINTKTNITLKKMLCFVFEKGLAGGITGEGGVKKGATKQSVRLFMLACVHSCILNPSL